eukprot:GHRQ01008337.1.p2 GENE.GHRQ01008337.1~~GHRQ01008337.1.p2  ORF type:complete len:138 (-),score=10.81 GHRQ01008337.1:1052-1465(-)
MLLLATSARLANTGRPTRAAQALPPLSCASASVLHPACSRQLTCAGTASALDNNQPGACCSNCAMASFTFFAAAACIGSTVRVPLRPHRSSSTSSGLLPYSRANFWKPPAITNTAGCVRPLSCKRAARRVAQRGPRC